MSSVKTDNDATKAIDSIDEKYDKYNSRNIEINDLDNEIQTHTRNDSGKLSKNEKNKKKSED